MQVLNVLAGNVHVHTPETGDQVHLREQEVSTWSEASAECGKAHGDEHGSERGELRENVVDLVVGVGH